MIRPRRDADRSRPKMHEALAGWVGRARPRESEQGGSGMTFALHTSRALRAGRVRSAALIALGVLAAILATAAPAAAASDPPVPSYQTNGRVWAIAIHNGVVYIGGDFTKVR